MSRPKVVALVSGGMDSVVALYHAHLESEVVAALSFDYGSKHNSLEIPFAKLHADRLSIPHQVIHLPFINQLFSSDLLQKGGEIPDGHYAADTMKLTVVPFRNGIMLAAAAGFAESAGAEALVIAAHAGDHTIYPDCREDFMTAMGNALRLGTYAGIQLLRPFITQTKGQIAAEGGKLGVDFSQTWSCYKGGLMHCGQCGTCVERREAFTQAGLVDPTVYASQLPLPAKPTKD